MGPDLQYWLAALALVSAIGGVFWKLSAELSGIKADLAHLRELDTEQHTQGQEITAIQRDVAHLREMFAEHKTLERYYRTQKGA